MSQPILPFLFILISIFLDLYINPLNGQIYKKNCGWKQKKLRKWSCQNPETDEEFVFDFSTKSTNIKLISLSFIN